MCTFLAETLLKKITKDVVGVCQAVQNVDFSEINIMNCFSKYHQHSELSWQTTVAN